ncbi:MAG: photosystem II cytochrome c-550 [Chroococcales cyanobacterium]
MLKRFFWVAVVTVFLAFQFSVGTASAVEVDENIRTVKLNPQGDNIVLSNEEVQLGKRKFMYACAVCHKGGSTRTNPNINLSLETLALAEPPRDNVEAIVDYIKNPTSYDGELDISEIHPTTKRADLYPQMRNLTEEDLKAIAGHILMEPKVLGRMWGGGKVYN